MTYVLAWNIVIFLCQHYKLYKQHFCEPHFPISLGKLEEEFEKKFNSLPQYSPMTFDKKGTVLTKKKKTDSSSVQEELSGAGKGKQNERNLLLIHTTTILMAAHLIHSLLCIYSHVFFPTLVVFRTSSFFVKAKTSGLITSPSSLFLCLFLVYQGHLHLRKSLHSTRLLGSTNTKRTNQVQWTKVN